MSNVSRPSVYVREEELECLSDLTHAVPGREPAATTLIEELSRARITSVEDVQLDVVRMYGWVCFNYDGALYDDFSLVHPNEANIVAQRISILTQVGAMLLGCASWIPCPGAARMGVITAWKQLALPVLKAVSFVAKATKPAV